MDTITQGILGAVTGQLGFRQKIGPDATWMAAGAAIVPDLDIFVTPFLSLSGAEVDDFTSLVIHRGLSHSLLLTPILAAPLALIWWWFRRAKRSERKTNPTRSAPPFWSLYACVFVALLSAPLLDWCTSYGTQLFAPITNARYSIHAIPIVDIIYTPLLIVTLTACYLVRKISRRPRVRTTLIIGWTGFVLSLAYIGAGRAMHDWAVSKAARTVDSETVSRIDAYPALGTIFLWRTVVETHDEWIAMRIHHFAPSNPGSWAKQSAPKTDNEWIRRGRDLPQGRTYAWFAGERIRSEYAVKDGLHVVALHDMRYALTTESVESLWPLTIIFDETGEVLHVGRERRVRAGSFRFLLWRLLSDIWNP